MKKKNLAVLAAALVLAAGAGTSYAYLTAQDDVTNTFDTAEVETVIEEEFHPEPPQPGKIIKKAPRVRSLSDTDCFVRMRYEFSNSDAQALCEPITANQGWTMRSDGYYYWDGILEPGQATRTLFDEIRIKSDIQERELLPFDILVYAEAVQSEGMDVQTAWASMNPQGGA